MKNVVMMILLAAAAVCAKEAKAQTIYDLLPPAEQGKVRGEKTFTVGLPVSDPYNMPGQYQVRPNSKLAVGLAYSALITKHRYDLADDERIKGRLSSAALYGEFYPIATSGFHLGVGVERRWGTFQVMKAVDGEEKIVMDGTYEAIYGGPSFGFTWIWNNGLTVGFDISQRKRFSNEFEVDESQATAREHRKEDANEKLAPERGVGMLLLGYSF